MRIVHIIGWFVYLLCFAAIAWAQDSETYRVTIGTNVDNDCDPGNEHTDCEDIPVFELQPEDYEQPPTPAEQWALSVEWKKNGQ